jgi:hypothetical protein
MNTRKREMCRVETMVTLMSEMQLMAWIFLTLNIYRTMWTITLHTSENSLKSNRFALSSSRISFANHTTQKILYQAEFSAWSYVLIITMIYPNVNHIRLALFMYSILSSAVIYIIVFVSDRARMMSKERHYRIVHQNDIHSHVFLKSIHNNSRYGIRQYRSVIVTLLMQFSFNFKFIRFLCESMPCSFWSCRSHTVTRVVCNHKYDMIVFALLYGSQFVSSWEVIVSPYSSLVVKRHKLQIRFDQDSAEGKIL